MQVRAQPVQHAAAAGRQQGARQPYPAPRIKGWCKYERSQYSMQLLLDANKVRASPTLPLGSRAGASTSAASTACSCCWTPTRCAPALP